LSRGWNQQTDQACSSLASLCPLREGDAQVCAQSSHFTLARHALTDFQTESVVEDKVTGAALAIHVFD
jgi:hypothetical protein